MKKVLASVMVLVLLATLSLTAFGAGSPISVGEWLVEGFTHYPGDTEPLAPTAVGQTTITFTKTPTEPGYQFDGWTITLEDGTTAVLGVDYEIVSGNSMSDTIVIKPLNDITVTENYSKIPTTTETAPTKFDGTVYPGGTGPVVPSGGKITTPIFEFIDWVMSLFDKTPPTTTPPTTTTPTTPGPTDKGPTAPNTGGSNLPAMGALALLALSVAFIAKKRYTA